MEQKMPSRKDDDQMVWSPMELLLGQVTSIMWPSGHQGNVPN